MKISLIGRRQYKYNDNIVINVPTTNQVRGDNSDDENYFWSEVNLFTRTPSEMISELDSMGVDFEEMNDYDLFVFLFLAQKDMYKDKEDLLFPTFNLWKLELVDNNGEFVFVNNEGKIIFDEKIYNEVSEIICYMTGHEKTKKVKFGNKYAKKKYIEHDYKKKEKERKKAEKEKSNSTMLDNIILRLVCNANFPYNFETIGDVTIFNLIYSLKQIDQDIQVTDLMQTRLVGNDLTKLPKEQLSRFIL